MTPPTGGAWTLYYRAHRKYARWRPVATAPTYTAAVRLIGCDGLPGGDWFVSDRTDPRTTETHHQPERD